METWQICASFLKTQRTLLVLTLLHRAASQGFTDICQVLLEYGARINQRTIWGWHTALHLALANGWEETAKFLISAGANIHELNKDKEDMCDFAIKRGYKTMGQEFRATAQKLESARRMKERKQRAMEISRKNAGMAESVISPSGSPQPTEMASGGLSKLF